MFRRKNQLWVKKWLNLVPLFCRRVPLKVGSSEISWLGLWEESSVFWAQHIYLPISIFSYIKHNFA